MPFKPGKSFKDINKKLDRTYKQIEVKIGRGVYTATAIIAAYAKINTPVDTSNLINRQYTKVDDSTGKWVGEISYKTSYALVTHDPAVPMNFKKPQATKLYLSSQYDKHKNEIDSAFAQAIKI